MDISDTAISILSRSGLKVNSRRMLVLPTELVDAINENRGDLTQAQFIEFLIDSHLEQELPKERYATQQELPKERYATQQELVTLEQELKGLLRSFLDFSISYNMDLGRKPGSSNTEDDFSTKLEEIQALAGPSNAERSKRK